MSVLRLRVKKSQLCANCAILCTTVVHSDTKLQIANSQIVNLWTEREREKNLFEVSTDTVPYPQNINAKDTVTGSCTYGSRTVVVGWLWRWSGGGVWGIL